MAIEQRARGNQPREKTETSGLLVITRNPGQSFFIGEGEDIEVFVLEIDRRHNSVRVGIKAPREVSVDRRERRMDKLRKKNLSGPANPQLNRPTT